MRPINFAAIDAGSNAIRLLIVRAYGPEHLEVLEKDRVGVRLGHHVFTRREFDEETVIEAVQTFRRFKKKFETYQVEKYRAVATSATRTAGNRQWLLESIFSETGIEVEVIGSEEEERLVRLAVLSALPEKSSPELIFDLGGGSLELCLLNDRKPLRRAALPIGTVRMMERYNVDGVITPAVQERIRTRVKLLLDKAFTQKPSLRKSLVVACGGNAENLADLAGTKPLHGFKRIDVKTLQKVLPRILGEDIAGRVKAFGVRRDRAEVMGVAAIIFSSLAESLGLESIVAAGVGVREGVILDLMQSYYGNWPLDEGERGIFILAQARKVARRYHTDMPHAEHVLNLACSLFDQLQRLHGLDAHLKLILELAALLHDIGHFVNAQDHHKHGEYLVENTSIDGLEGPLKDLVAMVVRYHRKSVPEADHKLYGALEPKQQRQIRILAGILRVAEGLDADHRQQVAAVQAKIDGAVVTLHVNLREKAPHLLLRAKEKARFLEKQLGVKFAVKVS